MGIALIIVCFSYIGILGLFIMHRLDCFISSGGFAKESVDSSLKQINNDVAVYIGPNAHVPNWSFKDSGNFDIVFITEAGEICNESSFKYIFAFSQSDMENLMVSSIAKKRNDVIYAGAVCNDPKNRKLFDALNIDVLMPEQFTPECMLTILNSIANRKVKLE